MNKRAFVDERQLEMVVVSGTQAGPYIVPTNSAADVIVLHTPTPCKTTQDATSGHSRAAEWVSTHFTAYTETSKSLLSKYVKSDVN